LNCSVVESRRGFTLVEVLVALALTGIIGITILNLYISSSRAYHRQLQVTEMQQNLRAGLDALVSDLRMAGYAKGSDAAVGMVAAGSRSVHFTMDLNGDGDFNDSNENLTFSIYKSSGIPRLGRKTAGGNNSPVAEYIEAMGFAYAFDGNTDGVLDADSAGRIHWGVMEIGGNWIELDTDADNRIAVADDTDADGIIDGIDTGIVAREEDIRAVKIWLLGRAPKPDPQFDASQTFVVGDRVLTFNDNYRRQLLQTSVSCRNMGI
jgi:type IV pilus assembly protein PilW